MGIGVQPWCCGDVIVLGPGTTGNAFIDTFAFIDIEPGPTFGKLSNPDSTAEAATDMYTGGGSIQTDIKVRGAAFVHQGFVYVVTYGVNFSLFYASTLDFYRWNMQTRFAEHIRQTTIPYLIYGYDGIIEPTLRVVKNLVTGKYILYGTGPKNPSGPDVKVFYEVHPPSCDLTLIGDTPNVPTGTSPFRWFDNGLLLDNNGNGYLMKGVNGGSGDGQPQFGAFDPTVPGETGPFKKLIDADGFPEANVAAVFRRTEPQNLIWVPPTNSPGSVSLPQICECQVTPGAADLHVIRRLPSAKFKGAWALLYLD